MFRALLAHLQEALHESKFGGRSLPTPQDQHTSTTAYNNHQICVRVVLPEDGQVMSETCRYLEP
jgi:hypothetical protein